MWYQNLQITQSSRIIHVAPASGIQGKEATAKAKELERRKGRRKTTGYITAGSELIEP
jgi:hypothetical protein